MIRKMPLPEFIRNVAVSDIRLSRDIIGVDRAVTISVTVANTGNEAVTPGALLLNIDDGKEYRDTAIGQLRTGEEQVTTFTHQFADAGAHSFSLTLEVEDDI